LEDFDGDGAPDILANGFWMHTGTPTPSTDVQPPGSGRGWSFVTATPNGVRVRYRVSAPGASVDLRAFDVRGRTLRVLESGWQPAGDHSIDWDRRDGSGERLARGVYWLDLRVGAERAVHRVVVAKH